MKKLSHEEWMVELYKKVQIDNLPKTKSLLEIKNRWKPICM